MTSSAQELPIKPTLQIKIKITFNVREWLADVESTGLSVARSLMYASYVECCVCSLTPADVMASVVSSVDSLISVFVPEDTVHSTSQC